MENGKLGQQAGLEGRREEERRRERAGPGTGEPPGSRVGAENMGLVPLIMSPALGPASPSQAWLPINHRCCCGAARQKATGRRAGGPEVDPGIRASRSHPQCGSTLMLRGGRPLNRGRPRKQGPASPAGNWQGLGPAPGDLIEEDLLSSECHPHLSSGCCGPQVLSGSCVASAPRTASVMIKTTRPLRSDSYHLFAARPDSPLPFLL